MKNTTDEFSFMLKPSEYGVGVFALHDIKEGTHLRLFGNEKLSESRTRILKKEEVPEVLSEYCIARDNDTLICPEDFGEMPVGWFVNHSKTPTAVHRNYNWYALRDIKAGEEITADYNSLEEPDDERDEYYKI